jgi:MoaA/NifB/PqqE/SkfB family radical SAM enzyme
MNSHANTLSVVKALLKEPQLLVAKPSINWYLFHYLRKFKVRKVGGRLIVHSHLPPLNSTAYRRFIDEHLLRKNAGPSHAQIGLTNACPQNCSYCYNRNRTGQLMDTSTIVNLIRDLKQLGVFWIGFTGGEPLLNKDIVKITESAGDGCVVKLFTTGCTLTKQLATDLKHAGLYSVSVSLDHWDETIHNSIRRYKGAFQTALKAIGIFQDIGGIDVGVSAVLSPGMIRNGQTEEFLGFLKALNVHEVWLSETKPSIPELWDSAEIITETERKQLVALQDRYNKAGEITVNYLGHFEGKEHFGCCAGHKMIYVDPFGSVSPCVFIPMSFGDVRKRNITEIVHEMKSKFPTEGRCFIIHNYQLLQQHYNGESPIGLEETRKILEEVRFTPYSRFFRLHYGNRDVHLWNIRIT